MRCSDCRQNCYRAGGRSTSMSERCSAYLPALPTKEDSQPEKPVPKQLALFEFQRHLMDALVR